ncbi:DUF6907 domain-containing protein [Streptomyces sp. NPDC004044]
MNITVPATFKPSGGIVAQRTAEAPATKAAPAEDRTITYPLHDGGFLVDVCPAWCINDHDDDIEHGLCAAEDLTHDGREVAVGFTSVEDGRDVLLAARIAQWPHSQEDGSEIPFMALLPNADSGEGLGYLNPAQVNAEIRRVEQHLAALRELNAQLVTARAEYYRTSGRGWQQVTEGDVKLLPIPALLKALDARVVEVETLPCNVQGFLHRDGDERVVYLLRSLPQAERELVVRGILDGALEQQA